MFSCHFEDKIWSHEVHPLRAPSKVDKAYVLITLCQMKLEPSRNVTNPASTLTLIFCTQTDTQMDRQADSSISPKTFILRGYKKYKFKEFCGQQNLLATQKFKFVIGRVEDNVGKGENAGYQHFFCFQYCFQIFLLLSLYSIDTHFDASDTSTTDSFWKRCGKRRNCL